MQLWDQPAPELAPRARPNAALMGRGELRALMTGLGEAAWRGDQVFEGLFKHRFGAWDEFTNLSKALKAKLAGGADIAWPEIVQSVPSRDGSTKHAFRLADGKPVLTIVAQQDAYTYYGGAVGLPGGKERLASVTASARLVYDPGTGQVSVEGVRWLRRGDLTGAAR